MKFYITGRVLPERTDVLITSIKNEIPEMGTVTFVCESSQINMTFDTGIDKVSAFILCKHHAAIIGTKRVKYVEQNIAATKVELNSNNLGRLENIIPLGTPTGNRYDDAGMLSID